MNDIEKELNLLSEYMDIYIQLLPYYNKCGGKRIVKNYMVTFEEYKENREGFVSPNYKDVIYFNKNGELAPAYTKGLGTEDGIAYRFYNYYRGCKYFIKGNIHGNYTFTMELQQHIKTNINQTT